MTDLENLIRAVEAGKDWISTLAAKALPPQQAVDACRAYGHEGQPGTSGSLDAAKRLHDALLPGWRVKEMHQFEAGHWLASVYHPQGDDWPKWVQYPAHGATADDPARAWVLAILRAMASTEVHELKPDPATVVAGTIYDAPDEFFSDIEKDVRAVAATTDAREGV